MTDSYDNSEAKEFRDLVWNILVELGKPTLVDFFPFLTWINPGGNNQRINGYSEKLIQLFDGLVNERSELKGSTNFLENTRTTDMLDELLKLQHTNKIDKTQIRHLFMMIAEEDISRLVYLQCILKETTPNTLVNTTPSRRGSGTLWLHNSKEFTSAGQCLGYWTRSHAMERSLVIMDSEINFTGHDYELIPFGAGRRMCPGLPLAMRMMPPCRLC
ncbi:hypothetical protein ACET3Z_014676 [Daucus carota]